EGVFDGRSARSGPASIPVSAEIGSSRPPHGAVLGGHTGVRIVMPFADRTGLLTLFGQRAVGLETSTVRDLGPPPGRGSDRRASGSDGSSAASFRVFAAGDTGAVGFHRHPVAR